MEWLIYLFKVSACMALFYAFYYFFLQKLTFFGFNRAYLLSTLLLSFVIPALQLTINGGTPDAGALTPVSSGHPAVLPVQTVAEPGVQHRDFTPANPADVTVSATAETNWQQLLPMVYWILAGAALSLFFYRLAQLIWHSRRTGERSGSLKLVNKPEGFTDCSFFNYVFIDRNKSPEALRAMLQHERIHAQKLHSLDKIFVSLCKCLLWFNPFIYLYDRSLEQVHEYEADGLTSSLVGNAVYANLLLSLAVNNSGINPPMVHSFVKNPVKERIKMLFTNPSTNMKKLTYLSLVPAGLALVWLFGVQVVYAEIKTKSENNTAVTPKQIRQSLSPTNTVSAVMAENVVKPRMLAEKEEEPEGPLRLIDYFMLGDDPEVIIDGKQYPAEILTRISPACMSSGKFGSNKVEIVTKNNRVEFATKAEIETAKIRRKIKAQARFYNRYPVSINGHKQDEILVRFGNSFAEASFPKHYRIALSIDGQILSEKQALSMNSNSAYHMTGIHYGYTADDPELFSKYGSKYDVILQFKNKDADSTVQSAKVTRGSSSHSWEGADGKFEHSAKDSTVYSADKRYITLFGTAKIINGKRSILSGDKIRFDAKTRIATAQNAVLTIKGKIKAVEGALLKVDIDKGTYEQLSGTPDF